MDAHGKECEPEAGTSPLSRGQALHTTWSRRLPIACPTHVAAKLYRDTCTREKLTQVKARCYYCKQTTDALADTGSLPCLRSTLSAISAVQDFCAHAGGRQKHCYKECKAKFPVQGFVCMLLVQPVSHVAAEIPGAWHLAPGRWDEGAAARPPGVSMTRRAHGTGPTVRHVASCVQDRCLEAGPSLVDETS